MNTLQKAILIVAGTTTLAGTVAAANSSYSTVRQECIDATNEGRELQKAIDAASSNETAEERIREANKKIRAACDKLFRTSEAYWQGADTVRKLGRIQDQLLKEKLGGKAQSRKNGKEHHL